MAMASCVCSPLKPPQLHYQRNNSCLPRINFQTSTGNFYCKPPFSLFYISRYSNKNWIIFKSGSRFQSRKSSHQDKESQFFSQDTEQISYSKNIDAKSSNLGSSSSSSTSLLSFLCPLLKLFSGGDPSGQRNYLLEELTSSIATLTRFPWGSRSLFNQSQRAEREDPPMLLQLFEFEACPFCRRVREALTELDLSVEVYPCPKGSVRHREMVKRSGGKEQFPFLFDPNTGISLYESSDIVEYLFQQYGKGRSPSFGLLESTIITGWMPTILRAGRGMTLWRKSTDEAPSKKLELFSFENNPYARIVRETLCELELPYVLHNVGAGSAQESILLEISGSKRVPYLLDPNTKQQIDDYKTMISYLFQTYSSSS